MIYIFRLIIIGACIAGFILVVQPRYENVKKIRSEIATFDTSLATAEKLKASREELIARYNSISKSDLDNIKTLLPDSVDNIRLIIQLDSLATKNGLSSLRDVDYQSESQTQAAAGVTNPRGGSTIGAQPISAAAQKPYGEFTISFQTSGQYSNFLNFLSDLEQNLRLVDVVSISFNRAGGNSSTGQSAADIMSYKVSLKTYWLKQ